MDRDRKKCVYQTLRKSDTLPSLPQVLLQVIETCEKEDVHLSELSALIRKDPAISSRLLKLVNSAAFGVKNRFVSLDQAVVYLGVETIKNITVTASVYQVFGSLKNSECFSLPVFWWHSLTTAVYARRIAEKTNYANLEEAYLAGLLNNLGELLLWMNFPGEYTAVWQEQPSSSQQLCALEEERIGINHCEAGAWLIRHWKLGSFLADAILYHHTALEQVQGGFPLVRIIRLATCCNRYEQQGLDGLYKAGEQLLGFHSGEIDDLRAGVEEEVVETAKTLGVKVKPPTEKRTEAEPVLCSDDGKLQELVKNYSLLNGFSASLLQARSRDEQLQAVEQALVLLFDCEKIIFFLRDFEQDQLRACCSNSNIYSKEIHDLTISLQQNDSMLVRVLNEGKVKKIGQDDEVRGLADLQLMESLGRDGTLYVPMKVHNKGVGLIVLGLEENREGKNPVEHDSDLLKLLAAQAAMSLYLGEVKRTQEQKIQEARLETAAMTAARVVHEVNNPLGIIRNYLKVVELKLSDESPVLKELAILDGEISRIARIVQKLDTFSTPAFGSCQPLDINKLLGGFLAVLSKSFLYSSLVRIYFQPAQNLPEIVSDGELVKQVVLNLVKNAVEAVGADGSVWVATAHTLVNGPRIEITVRDDGPGIGEKELAHIFDPFFSSKGKGHSGLGLAIVSSLVKELSGSVNCKSKPGKGSEFIVSLPLVNRSTANGTL
ncbi:hypothetical protein DGMP_12730 [Desulfomarina profundi]|uniref:histidine kinase n=1 Tax=Desulfomarina profundi TaxID=2772557 RepID=A0A8D5FH70_9BACT|nr:HDOD domain-containing protein [Desulfomarina profundi]BCL60580.1 hypothetical protein DGMP_12730 [Desulfomarina profundi]